MGNKKCFLVCPIGEEGSDTRINSDKLLDYVLKPVLEQKDYEIIRADKILQADLITDSIIYNLENAELVIADITQPNPNVYFELGYRTALKKPVIQIAVEKTRLPFDISVKRTFFYNLLDVAQIENFKTLILTVIDNIESSITTEIQNVKNNMSETMAMQFMKELFLNPQMTSNEKMNNFLLMYNALNNSEKDTENSSE